MRDDSHETRRQGLIDPDGFEYLPRSFARAAICAGLGFDLAQCVPAEMERILWAMSYQKEKLHLEWAGIAVIILSITVVLWMISAAF